MIEQVDYSKLEFCGYDKSISANVRQPEGVLLFERKVDPQGFESILLNRQPISVPQHQFRTEMTELEMRIGEIEGSWKYQKVINFDTTELDNLRVQYAEMRRLEGQIEESERPMKRVI